MQMSRDTCYKMYGTSLKIIIKNRLEIRAITVARETWKELWSGLDFETSLIYFSWKQLWFHYIIIQIKNRMMQYFLASEVMNFKLNYDFISWIGEGETNGKKCTINSSATLYFSNNEIGIVTEYIKVFGYSNDRKNVERNKALPAYLST